MALNWIKVFTTTNFYQAEITKLMLASHGIEAVILNRQDSAYRAFGDIEVYVQPGHFAGAIEMLVAQQPDISGI